MSSLGGILEKGLVGNAVYIVLVFMTHSKLQAWLVPTLQGN